MGKMWIGKPYLERQINKLIEVNEEGLILLDKGDYPSKFTKGEYRAYLTGIIEAYEMVLNILRE